MAVSALRLRILHVVPTYYPAVRYGGPIRSVHGLAAALSRRGHDVHVYTTNVDGPDDLEVPQDHPVLLDGVAVHYFRVPALRRLYWAPALATRMRSLINEFDVVHLHSVFLWPTWAAARIAASAGVPYIMTPRGMLIRHLIRRKSPWVKTAWLQLVERGSLARAAGVHVTAELEAAELRSLGFRIPEIFCIPNGVDFPSEPAGVAATAPGLPARFGLFLSRISWKKGLDRLITAWQWVPDLPLVIAGNDEEGHTPKLRALAQALGIADRVHFVGPISDAHKWSVYAAAELFVLPSYSENFGNVVAEAMAMGCPVIVTPEVGIAALVAAAGAGIVSSGEPAALAAAITAVLGDGAARGNYGRRGRELARSQLSWSAVAAQIEKLYLDVATPSAAAWHSMPTASVQRSGSSTAANIGSSESPSCARRVPVNPASSSSCRSEG
jgi:glycosyltransferase involved in cell wall biosynthesis